MVCVGGFGPIKNRPVDLLTALEKQPRARNLTIVSNGFPHQPLAENRQVKKFIGAFGGSVYRRAAASEEQIRSGELEFEPSPQGIFTERLRAGAGGLGAFFSPVGVHTVVADNKERRTIDGREYILESALRPDFGLIRAEKADAARQPDRDWHHAELPPGHGGGEPRDDRRSRRDRARGLDRRRGRQDPGHLRRSDRAARQQSATRRPTRRSASVDAVARSPRPRPSDSTRTRWRFARHSCCSRALRQSRHGYSDEGRQLHHR